MKSVVSILVLVASLVFGGPLRAAPANDAFENRTLLVGGSQTISGTNDLATTGPEDSAVLPSSARASVWWQWTAPTNGLVKLVVVHTAFPFTLDVFSGSDWTDLTSVVGLSDFGLKQTEFVVAAGQPYVFGLASRSTTGQFHFRIEFSPAPENDAFAEALEWGPTTRLVEISATMATRESGEPQGSDPELDAATGTLWWRWTAPSTGRFAFRLWATDAPSDVRIYTGDSLEALIPLGVSRNEQFGSEIRWDATGGVTYRVAAVVPRLSPFFFLSLLPIGTPTNDAFADRIPLSGTNVLVSGNSVGATLEPVESGSGGSVWWSWTAPENGRLGIVVTNLNYPLSAEILAGDSLSDLALVATAEFGSYGPHYVYAASARVIAGRKYVVRVFDAAELAWQGAMFDLQLQFYPTPVGDEFENPIELTGTEVIQAHPFTGASDEAWESELTGLSIGQSLWFEWTAPASASYCATAISTNYPIKIVVMEGDSTNSLATHFWAGLMDNGTAFWAIGGQTYRFLVHAGRPWPWGGGGSPPLAYPAFEFALYPSRITIPTPVHGEVVAFDSTVNLTPEIVGPVQSQIEFQLSLYPGTWRAKTPYPGHYNWRVSEFGTNGFMVRAMIDGRQHQTAPTWFHVRPHNDAFVFAEDFTGRSGYIRGTIREASLEEGESTSPGDIYGASVWYVWRAPENGPTHLIVDTAHVTTSVFAGEDIGSLMPVPTIPAGTTMVTNMFQAQSGTLYRIRVSATTFPFASFYLRIPRQPPPLACSMAAGHPPRLEFRLLGNHDTIMYLQASTNLVNWEILGYNEPGEQKTWTDPEAATLPLRFYRAVPIEDAFQ